jgi:hypothetical protein
MPTGSSRRPGFYLVEDDDVTGAPQDPAKGTAEEQGVSDTPDLDLYLPVEGEVAGRLLSTTDQASENALRLLLRQFTRDSDSPLRAEMAHEVLRGNMSLIGAVRSSVYGGRLFHSAEVQDALVAWGESPNVDPERSRVAAAELQELMDRANRGSHR